MKIENQVCSLELSIKLHKLGVISPSLFYTDSTKNKNNEIEMWDKPNYCPDNINRYTVAELGEMLPLKIRLRRNMGNGGYMCAYNIYDSKIYKIITHRLTDDKNEANARAKMLIYLIENNY